MPLRGQYQYRSINSLPAALNSFKGQSLMLKRNVPSLHQLGESLWRERSPIAASSRTVSLPRGDDDLTRGFRCSAAASSSPPTRLVVDRPGVIALGTLVEHRLALVHAPQLHRVEPHLPRAALHARLLHHHPLRTARPTQRRLLLVRLGPEGDGTVGGGGGAGGERAGRVGGEVRGVAAVVAADGAGGGDGEGGVTVGAERPRHRRPRLRGDEGDRSLFVCSCRWVAVCSRRANL
mmetsp:Transcript_19782/g.42427  ORF Transcript_19782/g.42427 Transcript_19782/m.42427 type:complete len:235 (+) Transcript_19782:139-843(+)